MCDAVCECAQLLYKQTYNPVHTRFLRCMRINLHEEGDFNLPCLCTDAVLRNSEYNRDAFIAAISTFLREIPELQRRVPRRQVCHRLRPNSARSPTRKHAGCVQSRVRDCMQHTSTHEHSFIDICTRAAPHPSHNMQAVLESTCPEVKRPNVSCSSRSETHAKLRILWNQFPSFWYMLSVHLRVPGVRKQLAMASGGSTTRTLKHCRTAQATRAARVCRGGVLSGSLPQLLQE
jgi:hypothetical protein